MDSGELQDSWANWYLSYFNKSTIGKGWDGGGGRLESYTSTLKIQEGINWVINIDIKPGPTWMAQLLTW